MNDHDRDGDDAERLRREDDDWRDAETRRPEPAEGAAAVLARTRVVTAYPGTSPNVFFGCESLIVLGTELEGRPGSVSGVGDTFYALNLGTGIPPVGTQVICTFVRFRWVFRYDG